MLSAVFMLMTFVVFAVYGLFAAAMRDHVISRPRVLTWMRRTFAAAFVALGAKLALNAVRQRLLPHLPAFEHLVPALLHLRGTDHFLGGSQEPAIAEGTSDHA